MLCLGMFSEYEIIMKDNHRRLLETYLYNLGYLYMVAITHLSFIW